MAVRAREALLVLLQVLAEHQGMRDVRVEASRTIDSLGYSAITARVAIRSAILVLGIRAKCDVTPLSDTFIDELLAQMPTLEEVSQRLADAIGAQAAVSADAPTNLTIVKPAPVANPIEQRIWFATDRHPVENRRLKLTFSGERHGVLTYGQCRVSIPRVRMLGSLPVARLFRFEVKPNSHRHFILNTVTPFGRGDFFRGVDDESIERNTRDAFVFVHGFNVNFENAALKSAQLAADLRLAGVPILYSWAARGDRLDYAHDGASVLATVERLQTFLLDLVTLAGVERINILAHSMGSVAVCNALNTLGIAGRTHDQTRLGNVVFAAPDIDAETYRNKAEAMAPTATGMTLYASTRDRAVQLARRLSGAPRLGGSIVVMPGVDTIDASDVDTSFLRHGYFSDARPMLQDLSDLYGGKPATERFGLEPHTSPHGRYYRLRP